MLTIEYLESTEEQKEEKSPLVLTKRWPLANDFGAYPFDSIIGMYTFWFVFFPPKADMAIGMSWTWFLNCMWLMVFHFINQSSMFWMTIIRKKDFQKDFIRENGRYTQSKQNRAE